MKADAVFEGGGVKGTAFVGAIQAFEDAGYEWNLLGGTSAGAITAVLLAAGYRAADLRKILMELDYRRFKDKGFVDSIPIFGMGASLIFEKGIYEGEYFERWLRDLLKHKGVSTFGDLRAPDGCLYRHRVQVLASDISEGRLVVLPSGLDHYGIEPDSFDVARAVRMSMSIPVYFEPVVCQGRYFVDGGLLSNFPVWLFDRQPASEEDDDPPPRWPTFGFKLVEPSEAKSADIETIVSFLKALITTMMDAHDRKHVEDLDFVRTVPIPTGDIKTTEFDLSTAKREWLFASGTEAAKAFLDGWDFEKYVATVRTPKGTVKRAARERYRERIVARSRQMIGSNAYLA